MGNKIYFMNNGDFDVRAMLTMGVSAKPENSIGFFGTGFKYAVAIVLRLGGSFKVSTLSGEYVFEARREEVRGKAFDIVYVNGREAGFTTHLGTNWKPWMAYRELYCNAIDEGGVISTDKVDSYDTIIEIDCREIEDAHSNNSDFFLKGDPVSAHHECSIYDMRKPYIYYKGIAVMDAPDKALMTYDITRHITLTEDRTARNEYEILWAMQRAIQNSANTQMLRKCLKGGDHYEAAMSLDPDWGCSKEFIAVCGELMNSDAGCSESARMLVKKFKDEVGEWPEYELNSVQKKMLERAKRFLFKIDIDIDRYPVRTVTGLGDDVMGRALDGVIYLSEIPFNMGTKQVASTLLEEWVHNKHGCKDFDRQMQSWLFDKILSLAELINGEPV